MLLDCINGNDDVDDDRKGKHLLCIWIHSISIHNQEMFKCWCGNSWGILVLLLFFFALIESSTRLEKRGLKFFYPLCLSIAFHLFGIILACTSSIYGQITPLIFVKVNCVQVKERNKADIREEKLGARKKNIIIIISMKVWYFCAPP